MASTLSLTYRAIVRVFFYWVVVLVIILVAHTSVHEYGHLLIARIDGAEVIDFQPWPVITWSGVQNPHTDASPESFSSKNVYILFKSGGFLITFIPSFLLWALLYYKKTKYWGIAFISMFLSFRGARTDFLQIGWQAQGLILATTLWLIIPFITWVLLGVWYLRKAMKNYATNHPRIFLIIQLILLVIIYL